jgi:7-cyano-7-deazaguanine synthase
MRQAYNGEDALVLSSGGQDSTTCLAWALRQFRRTSAIGFRYGQKHSNELDAARSVCESLGVPFKEVDVSFMKDVVVSNLLEGTDGVTGSHPQSKEVPSTFVPYRNLLFLTIAAGWAGTIGARHVVTGVCETDFSGYADCRDVFVKSAQVTLNLATDFREKNVVIHTPLMWLTKAEEFKMAEELGCLDLILEKTLTCYEGVETMRDFGKGCGECPSCLLRKRGWEEYMAAKGVRDAR